MQPKVKIKEINEEGKAHFGFLKNKFKKRGEEQWI